MSRLRSIFFYGGLLMLVASCDPPVHKPETDWDRWHLKGQVKALSEITYSASGKYKTVILFNQQGYVTEQASYNPDGSLIRKWVFQYRKDNLKNKLWCYVLNDSLAYTQIYQYDWDNNLLSINIEKPDGSYTVQAAMGYDADNRKIREQSFTMQGALEYETIYAYESNRVVREEHHDAILHRKWKQVNRFNASGEKEEEQVLSMTDSLWRKIKFQYNSKGQLLDLETYDASNTLNGKISRTYTENGDEQQRISTLPNGDVSEKREQQYRYDAQRNWIFKSVAVNGQPGDIITRDIQYYQ